MEQIFPLSLFSLLLLIHCPLSLSQSPAAPAPAPSGPTNLTAALEKAGQFGIFIRLLQSTKVGDQIETQLNDSNQGLTVFAPTDGSFSGLKSGMLNSFTDEQKVELIQFHVLPEFFSPAQFQTASNPVRTQAGGGEGQFSMNVTATGSQVNITTGETNATVANTVYTDGQLAVYQVDRVLLPLSFFVPPPPPPPPLKAARSPESGDAPPSDAASADSSGADCLLYGQVIRGVTFVVVVMLLGV
ncbi:fasciclin-like arabinogalactan protein 12 [Andrographis paniculata]|uniref:fasciclin-like arabinogalactan protein 12 n=1 Tax=Andrographis paniculata TaxID=175694 RepID=UPI0021E6E090|nr:fasciclin-like arabinogalactan protein 12 [Andrographis paniculata]